MELNAGQKRMATQKPKGHQLIKGVFGSGKTAVGLYRVLFLLDNYCFAKDDAILLAAYNRSQVEYMEHLHKKMKGLQGETLPLFSGNHDKLDIRTVDSVMASCFKAYMARKDLELGLGVSDNLRMDIIDEGITELQDRFPKVNLLDRKNIRGLLKEIDWIKNCLYHDKEAYQSAQRKGMAKKGGEGFLQRLRKNSDTRRAIIELMDIYDREIRNRNLIDRGDMRAMALEQARCHPHKKYTHIIVDETQALTRSQLLFLKEIYNEKEYSSMLFISDTTRNISPWSWLGSGRSFASIGFSMKGRSYTLNEKSGAKKQTARDKKLKAGSDDVNPGTIELNYRNFKTGQASSLCFDPNAPTSVELDHQGDNEVLKAEQLTRIPVYGRIQAGVPVHMNAELDEDLYLPAQWIRGADHFALQVSGDSMTGADINDGDVVVIRKQNTADNLDIVAVALGDEATLKRFRKIGTSVVLTAENSDYDPISLKDECATILGRAVGLIKK